MYNEDDIEELVLEDENLDKSLPPIRLELDGVSTEEEIKFIKSKGVLDADNPVDLFIVYGLDLIPICKVDLNIDLLINLKYIGLNQYTLTLVNGDKKIEILKPNIDESAIEMLLNFVRIGGLR